MTVTLWWRRAPWTDSHVASGGKTVFPQIMNLTRACCSNLTGNVATRLLMAISARRGCLRADGALFLDQVMEGHELHRGPPPQGQVRLLQRHRADVY